MIWFLSCASEACTLNYVCRERERTDCFLPLFYIYLDWIPIFLILIFFISAKKQHRVRNRAVVVKNEQESCSGPMRRLHGERHLLGTCGDPSLIPGTHMKVGGEKRLPRILFRVLSGSGSSRCQLLLPHKGHSPDLIHSCVSKVTTKALTEYKCRGSEPKNRRRFLPSLTPEGVAKAG